MSSRKLRRGDSDSEDDPDYIPPTHELDSDSERDRKRIRKTSPGETDVKEDKQAQESNKEALWSDFKTSLPTTKTVVSEPSTQEMVKIEKRYRFAGEDVVEVKEVHKDSDEAKKWPLWKPPAESQPESSTSQSNEPSTTPVPSTSNTPKPAKRPGPRKPKTSLTPLPGSQKAKKLTTLDKSAMDWRAHVDDAQQASGLKDELDANRRGGGYLEKVEFLQRVEQRKDEAFEASKSTKRRRG